MGKLFFSGDKSKPVRYGSRSYLDAKAFDPTPPQDKNSIQVPVWLLPVLSVLLPTGLLVWLLFFSNLFKIKSVNIKGDARVETVETVKSLIGKNIFTIGGKKAEKSIQAQQPGIKMIKVIRGLPSTVVVELVERDPAIIWQTDGKKFLVDRGGIAYKESGGNFPIVIDQKNIPLKVGTMVASPNFIFNILKLNTQVSVITGLDIENINIPETTFQIEIATKSGIKLKLDTSQDIDRQLGDIKYVLVNNKDKIKELIDVRIEGYAYIK